MSALRAAAISGELTLTDARGRVQRFTGGPGPNVAVRVADIITEWKLIKNPELTLGEAYMDGRLIIESGSLYDFLDFCAINFGTLPQSLTSRLRSLLSRPLRRFHQFNPITRSRRNVAHHYDLDGHLYDLFLDEDKQYSCAYFSDPNLDLDEAQAAKKRHITRKLLLRPEHRVLDIGSGWGGLALSIARSTGASVDGLTLSEEQFRVASQRARQAGLSERVRFHLQDYREVTGIFDRIVSVGMFEHVGVNHYENYFRCLRRLLASDGVALVHSIGRVSGPSATSSWIKKYIFPGGYIPALSEVVPSIEKAGLWITDIEILRLHYADTLKHWRDRFMQHRSEVASLYDERFCRMWEFYLATSEIFFRRMDGMVFQIQLATERHPVPLTRDYLYEPECKQTRQGLHAA